MDAASLLLAIERLSKAIREAGEELSPNAITVEFAGAPHRQPSQQPIGRPAVYAFFFDGRCLKCGIVGPNSNARYTSQHYNPNSAKSTLASSLLNRGQEIGFPESAKDNVGAWIKANTARANLLFPASTPKRTLNFAEAFLHVLWKPVFEGHEWRDWSNST